MKKIYILAIAALFAGSASAQIGSAKADLVKQIPTKHTVQNNKAITDTAGWSYSGNYYPEFATGGQVVRYIYTGGGYVYGNNLDGLNVCGQGYSNVNAASFKVVGVLAWFAAKDNNDNTASVAFSVYTLAPNKALGDDGAGGFALNSVGPDQMVGSAQTLLLSAADTAWPNLTYTAFTNPPVINGTDFAVMMDANDVATKNDTVGLFSDQNGEGQKYAFHNYQGSWYVTNDAFGGNLDNNIALFPVLDDAVGVEDEAFFYNMQLSNYPNPASNNTTISYRLAEDMANVSVVVYDVTGKEVANFNEGSKAKGLYKINLDASNLDAGTYLYSVIGNGNRLTKRMTITK